MRGKIDVRLFLISFSVLTSQPSILFIFFFFNVVAHSCESFVSTKKQKVLHLLKAYTNLVIYCPV